MPTLTVAKFTGDPTQLEKDYVETYTALAGLRGRGKDWGVPSVILRHVCAAGADALWIVDVYESEDSMRNLIFERDKLPEDLVPEAGSRPCLYDGLAERWESDVRVMRVGKVLPPLRTVLSDGGVPLRLGAL